MQQTTYRDTTLSDYFKKMSVGSFIFIGDVYDSLVITNYSATGYQNYGVVNSEVINKIKNRVNWNRYDNWTRTTAFQFSNTPDGEVDLVIIIYRSKPNILWFSGIAELGFDAIQVSPTKQVRGWFPNIYGNSGGGITLPNGVEYTLSGQKGIVPYLAHEFGHFLFDGGHTRSSIYTEGYGLMGGTFSPCMNADERRRLGWLSIPDLPSGQTTISDYMTTNAAYKIPISADEYFLIENHQKISIYDGAGYFNNHPSPDPFGKGLYIFHMYNVNSNYPSEIYYTTKCADGRFNLTLVCQPTNPYNSNGTVRIWQRNYPNPKFGYDEIEAYNNFLEGSPCTNLTSAYYTGDGAGDKEDAFNIGYNQIFSPYSNPGTHSWD